MVKPYSSVFELLSNSLKKILPYGFIAVLSFFVFALLTDLKYAAFHIPFKYEGDALLHCAYVKTILETGWIWNNPYLAAPNQYSLADFPLVEGGYCIIIKLISLLSKNPVTVFNAFYVLSFPLVAVVALFVFKELGLNKFYAMAASIVYTFLPYHFARGQEHLFLSCYYVVPLGIWLAFGLAERKFVLIRS